MKRIFILGNKGGMGRRYSAILDSLNIPHIGVDPYNAEDIKSGMKISDGVIIATPTCTHLDLIKEMLQYGKPILCEKPFTTNLFELERFHANYSIYSPLISMVNQYQYLFHKDSQGETYYNYFKTGNDGLEYDCINIIGQAKGKVEVGNTSPLWTCKINGQKISIADIDLSYVSLVLQWTKGELKNYDYAIQAHYKVAKYIADTCNDSGASALN